MTSISDTEVVNAPGGLVELGYSVAPDTTVTATTIGSAHQLGSVTFVSDGSPVLVEFSAGVVSPPTNNSSLVFVALEVDGSTTNRIYWISFRNSASAGNYLDQSAYAQERLVLSAGTHTIRTLAWCSGGTNGVVHSGGNYSPAITRVSKILQASQLLVTQANAPVVTQLPVNPVQNQEVYLYSTYGYTKQRYIGAAWEILEDNRKVYFQAHTNAVLGTTGGATMAFNRTIINQGNCFNTSTYLFTAPFAGDYKFRVQAQKRYTGIMQMLWLINGSTTNNRGVYIDIGNDSPGPNMEVMLSLSTGNTVGVHYTLSAGDVYGSPQEYFTYFQGEYLK